MKTEEENDLVDVSKELSKNEKFDKINDDSSTTVNSSYCKELSNGKSPQLKVFCENILNKLNNLEKEYIKNNNHDFCPYFSYWTYEQIMNKFSTTWNNSLAKCDISKLNSILSYAYNIIIGKSCTFDLDGKFDDWKEEKYLYYYFKKYNDIKKKKSEKQEQTKYCKYLEQIKILYERHINKCCTYFLEGKNHENGCQKYFNCEEEYNPYDLMSELKCEQNSYSEYWKTVIQDLIIDRDKMKNGNSLKETLNKLMNDPFYKAVTFGFVVVGVLFASFLFYKISYRGKNKYNFLDPSGNLARFYEAKSRKTKWGDSEIRLSYYSM
ncbi:PIR Superfamily Protein [Plasmodium malariae]|uniref:PIR Superfamily Protein n=1 Tax=Plasmodium malariae TaxID=5858 RepID=A0A1A8X4W5_PLAMA|nr:PIR Superfamily Protein [Plasmodium malariae]